jgi:hypothetical protein
MVFVAAIGGKGSPSQRVSTVDDGKISGFAAAAVMPFFGQQPAGCVPRSP